MKNKIRNIIIISLIALMLGLVMPVEANAVNSGKLGIFTQSVIQMNKYILTGNTTMTVVLSQDADNPKKINIVANDTTYKFVSMKWVKGAITTKEEAAIFDTDQATTIEIEESSSITASFIIDTYETYTVYAKNSNGDIFLSRINTAGRDVPTITVTKDETNKLKTTIVAEDGDEQVVSLKIVKKATKDEEPDFENAKNIEITPAKTVTVEYTFEEEGIYAIRATDTSGNSITKTIYIYKDFPITVNLTAENKTINIEATGTLSNIVSIQVTNEQTQEVTDLTIETGKTVNTLFVAPDYGQYTINITDEIGFKKEMILTLVKPSAPVASVTYTPAEKTNGEVKAEITFDQENVKITSFNVVSGKVENRNGDSEEIGNTFYFTENGSITFEYEAENGITGQGNAEVSWIDPVNIEKVYKIMELENKKYLRNIEINTTTANLLKNINVIDADYKVCDSLGNSIATDAKLATSNILKAGEEEYSLIVTGDINGDGKMSSTDISQMILHLLDDTILTGANFYAADMNNDNQITLTDLSQLKTKLIEE